MVEVGQPWRNQRAGLADGLLSEGRVITVHGRRSSEPGEYLLNVEQVVIDGRRYDLYPDRKS